MYTVTNHLQQRPTGGDDSLLVLEKDEAIWFCVADGAGGTGSGSLASQYISKAFRKLTSIPEFPMPEDFESFLRKIDFELMEENSGGESTAIIGVVSSGMVSGASVGDSEAWLFNSEYELEISNHQIIKPLLGSGRAIPIGFGPIPLDKHLLVASDGLFKYTEFRSLRAKLNSATVASELTTLAALPNGSYQDDVSVILIEKKS